MHNPPLRRQTALAVRVLSDDVLPDDHLADLAGSAALVVAVS